MPEFDPTRVPQFLRDIDQWVCWRYELKDGRWTKVPYTSFGQNASVADPGTWRPFRSALDTWTSDTRLDGVGFVVTERDEITGIDIDDCRDDGGAIAPVAQDMVDLCASYAEVSPSGAGVRIFVGGRLPDWSRNQNNKVEGIGKLEVYSTGRYLTVTSNHILGTPLAVENRQEQLESICDKYLRPPNEKKTRRPDPGAGFEGDDEELIEKAMNAKNGAAFHRLWDGDTSAHGDDDSAADMALCSHLAFWTAGDADRMDRLFRLSGLMRDKWDERRSTTTYGEMTVQRAIDGCTETYGDRRPPARFDAEGRKLPIVTLDTDEHRVIDEVVEELAGDGDLFQRGSVLVRLGEVVDTGSGIKRGKGEPTIQLLPSPNLRERITRVVQLEKDTQHGIKPAHPPGWLVSGIEARGNWRGMRQLTGLFEAPVLRPDGTVVTEPGYDEATGVLYLPSQEFPALAMHPARADAMGAARTILEIVCDFRFQSDAHRAAWLAALLTFLGRHAFDGPAPLFLLDANIRGAGKTLLAQTIARIVQGRDMPVATYSHNTEEMRKLITSIAIAGDNMILLDNLAGRFGNDALDRALTSTRWKDRVLGRNELADLPLRTVWMASGNNVTVGADTIRRVLHIRLNVLEERPEERRDFRHMDLRAHVLRNRAELLVSGLTILSAYILAGKPRQPLTPFGSFEGWSDLIRQCVVWLGLPDPCETRATLAESADTERASLAQLMDAWAEFDVGGEGLVIAELVEEVYGEACERPREIAAAMRAALEGFVNLPVGKTLTARAVGAKLKSVRMRVVGGRYFDHEPQKGARGVVWKLIDTE
jgi:hypothetical protein